MLLQTRLNPSLSHRSQVTAQSLFASARNRYQNWTPRLLKAAYNYQFIAKDPGAYTHNPHYAIQLLQDSLADLGKSVEVDMAGMIRP